MEYIEGEDLEEKLRKAGGPLPKARVLPWTGQILDALAYLHRQNPPIIHRNINRLTSVLLLRGRPSWWILDRQALRDALANTTRYEGVTGVIQFQEGSGDPVKSAAILMIQNRKFVFLTNANP